MQKSYEIISIENSYGKYWLVTYMNKNGQRDAETIEALDSNEAFIKFRNLMIKIKK